jgi:hypothetical protein
VKVPVNQELLTFCKKYACFSIQIATDFKELFQGKISKNCKHLKIVKVPARRPPSPGTGTRAAVEKHYIRT